MMDIYIYIYLVCVFAVLANGLGSIVRDAAG